MSTTKFTSGGTQTKTFEELLGTLRLHQRFTVGEVSSSCLFCTILHSKTHSSHQVILRGITVVLIYFNSTLNPFLYRWKIREERQAMKQTIRQALCCPWSQTILLTAVKHCAYTCFEKNRRDLQTRVLREVKKERLNS